MEDRETSQRTAASLRRFLTPEHPDAETTLVAYVDGTLDREEREAVEEHLAGCAVCREDVGDLRQARASLERTFRPQAWAGWLLAAGVGGALLLGGLMLTRNQPPASRLVTTRYGRTNWDALAHDARTTGHIAAPPVWKALQAGPDVVRGIQGTAMRGTFTPTGTVIESQQPAFSWPGVRGAAYVVRVSSGNDEIAHSELLRVASWTPATPFPRGTTYEWQVEVHDRSGVKVIPNPPNPPLLFAIADEQSARDLAAARRNLTSDHFLLGVLYARAGLRDEAAAELRTWLGEHPADTAAQRLLDDIGHW